VYNFPTFNNDELLDKLFDELLESAISLNFLIPRDRIIRDNLGLRQASAMISLLSGTVVRFLTVDPKNLSISILFAFNNPKYKPITTKPIASAYHRKGGKNNVE
jgi:hypothetical protein